MLPGLLFLALAGLSSGLLHMKKNFVIPAMAGYPYNLIIITTAIYFGRRYGVIGLAWGTMIAFASQFLIQVPSVVRHGIFKKEKLLWGHPGIKKMAILLPPVILGGAAQELKSIIDRVFGSLLPEGSIAALNFSNRIYLLPNGILILALLTVLYPTLVELHVEGKVLEFKETLRQVMGLVILLVFPMMVGLIVLRIPVVRLLFERGAFDATATGNTAFALAFYSMGLVALGIQLLITRAFYALKDTLTPMCVTLLMVVLNIFFNWLLIKPLAHGGIALGTALSINIGAIILAYLLWRKIGAFGGKRLLATFWKCGVAALIMGIILIFGIRFLHGSGFLRQAAELGILISAGAMVYFVLIYWLRVEELRTGLGFVRRRLAR
jgi:putative peptidoglycan lipid II flippase